MCIALGKMCTVQNLQCLRSFRSPCTLLVHMAMTWKIHFASHSRSLSALRLCWVFAFVSFLVITSFWNTFTVCTCWTKTKERWRGIECAVSNKKIRTDFQERKKNILDLDWIYSILKLRHKLWFANCTRPPIADNSFRLWTNNFWCSRVHNISKCLAHKDERWCKVKDIDNCI